MRLPRLHVELPDDTAPASGRLPLSAPRSHYLQRVLRLVDGAEVEALDGRGHVGRARLLVEGRKNASLDIRTWNLDQGAESPLTVTLGLVMIRGQRMDYAVQKATELGVRNINLLTSERCEVRARSTRLDHLREVAISALEQCGRTVLPGITAPRALDVWLADAAPGSRWLLHPAAGAGPPALDTSTATLTLLSGPEGGFSDAEVHAACAAGFAAVNLGPRTLRAETAPLVALSIAQGLAGDLGQPQK